MNTIPRKGNSFVWAQYLLCEFWRWVIVAINGCCDMWPEDVCMICWWCWLCNWGENCTDCKAARLPATLLMTGTDCAWLVFKSGDKNVTGLLKCIWLQSFSFQQYNWKNCIHFVLGFKAKIKCLRSRAPQKAVLLTCSSIPTGSL